MTSAVRTTPASKSRWIWLAGGVGFVALFLAWRLLPAVKWVQWIHGLGPVGYALFALVYIAGAVLFAPETPLTMAGGRAFGVWAVPLVIVAATVGASLAFLVARYLAHRPVERLISTRPAFKAVQQAISREGWKVVLLLRLSPVVPFNFQNYLFGVTDVPFWKYVAATGVGIVPGTILYVYLGMLGQIAVSPEEAGAWQWAFFAAGLLATLLVTILVTKKAKSALEHAGVPNSAES